MAGCWRKDADRIGNVAKHLWKIMIFVLRVLIIPKHIYLKILNEYENVIKNVIKNAIKNVIKNAIKNVIKNVIKINFF